MKKLFVPYAIAKLAKKKGFDEPCFAYYCKHRNTVVIPEQETLDKLTPFLDVFAVNSQKHFVYQECSAPIHQQLCDWLLEKHNLDIHAHKMWHYSYNYEEKRMVTFYQVSICDFTIDREARDSHGDRIYQKYISSTELKTYKEAIEDGITWALKHIK